MHAVRIAVLAFALTLGWGAAHAQTAAVTATCKDGTSYSGTTRRGACSGHGGVQAYGSAAAAAPAAAAPATSTTPSATASPAPAGSPGNGQVWVNTATKVYHCPGTRYYGKTKAGSYMSEAAAKAAGDRPNRGKACS